MYIEFAYVKLNVDIISLINDRDVDENFIKYFSNKRSFRAV